MNQPFCSTCGNLLKITIHDNKPYGLCKCTIIPDNLLPEPPQNLFGRYRVEADGARWQYTHDAATVIDFASFRPEHIHYYFEKSSDRAKFELHKENVLVHKKHYKEENQFKLDYGWRQPQKVGPYAGKPAFIVTSGPSIKKNGHLLKDLPGPVIAVNSAIKNLPEPPDWYVYGEPWADFDEWHGNTKPMKPKEGILIYGGASTSILRHDWGRKVYFNMNNSGNKDYSCTGIIAEHMPNAHRLINAYCMFYSCIHMAYLWGCNPIILVGADHSWTSEYHGGMKDTDHYSKFPLHFESLDLNGSLVMTSKELSIVSTYIELQSTFLALAGTALINCTEGGITYKRTMGLTLAKFLDDYKKGYRYGAAGVFKMAMGGEAACNIEYTLTKEGKEPEMNFLTKEDLHKTGGTFGRQFTIKDAIGYKENKDDNKKRKQQIRSEEQSGEEVRESQDKGESPKTTRRNRGKQKKAR